MHATDQLPPLTEHQEHILSRLLHAWTEPSSPFNPTAHALPAVARSLNLSLAQLLAELSSPALSAHLGSVRDLTQLESTLHAAHARRIAVDTLAAIAADDEADPIERRRASTAILRATATPRRRNAALQPASEPAPPVHVETPPADPNDLINHVLRVLGDDDNDAGLATLHACLAPGATLNGEPVPEDVEDFLADIEDDTRETLTSTVQRLIHDSRITAETSWHNVTFVRRGGKCTRVLFHGRPFQDRVLHDAGLAEDGHPVLPDDTLVDPADSRTWRFHAITLEPIDTGYR